MSCLGLEIGRKHSMEAWWSDKDFSYDICRYELDRMSPEDRAQFDDNPFTYGHFKKSQDERFNWCRFYRRDRNSKDGPIFGDFTNYQSLAESYGNGTCEYLYLFAGGTWWTDAYCDSAADGLMLLYDAVLRRATDTEHESDIALPLKVGPEPLLRKRAMREGYGGRAPDAPASRIEYTGGRRPIAL